MWPKLSAGVTGVRNHTLRLSFAVLRPSRCLHCVPETQTLREHFYCCVPLHKKPEESKLIHVGDSICFYEDAGAHGTPHFPAPRWLKRKWKCPKLYKDPVSKPKTTWHRHLLLVLFFDSLWDYSKMPLRFQILQIQRPLYKITQYLHRT